MNAALSSIALIIENNQVSSSRESGRRLVDQQVVFQLVERLFDVQ